MSEEAYRFSDPFLGVRYVWKREMGVRARAWLYIVGQDGKLGLITGREDRRDLAAACFEPQTMEVLGCFLRHPSEDLPRATIEHEVWTGRSGKGLQHYVSYIRQLLLDNNPAQVKKDRRHPDGKSYRTVETIEGLGYRFLLPVDPPASPFVPSQAGQHGSDHQAERPPEAPPPPVSAQPTVNHPSLPAMEGAIQRPAADQPRPASKYPYLFGIASAVLFLSALGIVVSQVKKTPDPPLPLRLPSPPSVGREINTRDGQFYVWIPPRTFWMGCSPGDHDCRADENPAHDVTIPEGGFWIGQTLVTWGAYARFEKGKTEHQLPRDDEIDAFGRKLRQGDDFPVVNVTWFQAAHFCAWMNHSDSETDPDRGGAYLPTEAQFEYASRANSPEKLYHPASQPVDYTKDDDDLTTRHRAERKLAWFADNSGKDTRFDGDNQPRGVNDVLFISEIQRNKNVPHKVGRKAINAFGLYDMLGNVEEWVRDYYDENYYRVTKKENPTGPDHGTQRVTRGGSYLAIASNVRVSNRAKHEPNVKAGNIGFRCVWKAPPPASAPRPTK
jgi:formylglycine-generating enzyme required for sulfatase activity